MFELTVGENESSSAQRGTRSLHFMEWKDRFSVSDRAFDQLRCLIESEFDKEVDDVRQSRRRLAAELGLYVETFDCCIHNCMAFTGEHRLRRKCIHCKSLRFRGSGGHSNDPDVFDDDVQFPLLKAEATYSYIPIIPRLKLLYASSEWARHMRYPTELFGKEWEWSDELNEPVGGIRDVWEGGKIQDLRQRGTV
jgi:hypothetical protein